MYFRGKLSFMKIKQEKAYHIVHSNSYLGKGTRQVAKELGV